MNNENIIKPIHPEGESKTEEKFPQIQTNDSLKCDTFGGLVHIEWDPHQPVTPYGQLPFFIEFLKTANLFEPWVNECPLTYTSPNGPAVRNILGTLFLSSLAGQKRYAHITAIRNDALNPPLLGMTKIVSEDSARRAFQDVDPAACANWQKTHLKHCYEALLVEPWILDIDTSVKTLYGHQEGAEIGYNPKKPGRPCHIIHTFMIAQLRIVLDCEVLPGKQHSSNYTMPFLWDLLDSLPPEKQPSLLRGDCAFGNEKMLMDTDKRGLKYLFKLKKTKGVKALIDFITNEGKEWTDAGQGWEGVKGELRLQGWSKRRSVLVLRRLLPRKKGRPSKQQALMLPFFDEGNSLSKEMKSYEYQIIVTNLDMEIVTLAQLYRDRGDAENVFDELKNQWGWGGFVTKDLLRSQIMARIIAQVYNWWALFVRFANQDKHSEGITSRPLLLYGVARQTISGRQKTFIITPTHGKAREAQERLGWINRVLNWIKRQAEQFSIKDRWNALLSIIFSKFLKGRLLGSIKQIDNEFLALGFG
jgi:hypothetical protein